MFLRTLNTVVDPQLWDTNGYRTISILPIEKYFYRFFVFMKINQTAIYYICYKIFYFQGVQHGSMYNESRQSQSRKAIIRMLGKWYIIQ